jgi:DNA helicase-2/ATP-dependent DNA helicase PcrA
VEFDAAEWGAGAAGAATASARAPAGAAAAPGWRIGQSVRHAKFGVGVIIDAEGRGADQRVQVNFRDVGVKWLALEFAKLEAA